VYIDCQYDKWDNEVKVWERTPTGRRLKRYPAPLYFYVPNEAGKYKSMYGDILERLDFETHEEFKAERDMFKSRGIQLFESDISPDIKVLMNEYWGKPSSDLHYTLFDIEVDVSDEGGFASVAGPAGPYAPINAITLWHSWTKKYQVYAVPPKNWKGSINLKEGLWARDDVTLMLCKNEKHLLELTLRHIEDTDLLSGWNSDFFDIPYLLKRTELVLGEAYVKHWTFDKAKEPQWSEKEKFGVKEMVVKMTGRQHLDYMRVFEKYNIEGRPSYSLDAIASDELDNFTKLEFDGSFEEFYNSDFEIFLEYNLRDVEVLVKIDEKFKYLAVAFEMAHQNTVRIPSILGTIAYVETSITNYAHQYKLIVRDKIDMGDNEKVEGAIVLTPVSGLHSNIAAIDINSLYPNTIRSLNISPEKVIGQFEKGEEDWRGIYLSDSNEHSLIFDNGDYSTATGKEWKVFLKDAKWAVSGYGTVFDQGNGVGLVPTVLATWLSDRKKFQKMKKEADKELMQLKKNKADANLIAEKKREVEQYDRRQYVKKISANSLYGALLNAFFRFNRKELGASTTGSGRQITTFMNETIGELITGKKVNVIKTVEVDDGEVHNIYTTDCNQIVIIDTDSSYFTLPLATSNQETIEMADAIADTVNSMFPTFMQDAFLCQPGFDTMITGGRELVADKGVIIARKSYVMHLIDKEGKAVDEYKIMGFAIKKSDTPLPIQKFLQEIIDMILKQSKSYQDISDFIMKQRKELFSTPAVQLSLGVTKAVNNFEKYMNEYNRVEKEGKGRAKMPQNARASINFNECLERFGDKKSTPIRSSDKVKILYVKPNEYKYETMAIPVDTTNFPKWFSQNFEVDTSLMEKKLIDLKLEKLFKVLDFEIPTAKSIHLQNLLEF
jgi:DNA polymerase elongation subunit (family B)